MFVTFPLKKDKIFAVVGLGWATFQDPPVAPGGGIIWLINDKLRLQGVFPKPALIYQPNDDWDFQHLGELNYHGLSDGRCRVAHRTQAESAQRGASIQRVSRRGTGGYSGIKHLKLIAGGGCTIERDFDFFRAHQAKRTIQLLTLGSQRK